MNRVEALPEAHPELWRGLPISSQYEQKKLLAEGVPGAGPGQHRLVVGGERQGSLRSFLRTSGFEFHVLVLGIYHLVLQHYLDDAESVIGCCLLERGSGGRTATLRPSHVFAEEDDSPAAFLAQVAGQLRAAPAVEADPAGASSWGAGRAPLFFLAAAADGGHLDPAETPAPGGLAILAASAGDDARPAEIRLSMPNALSAAVPAEEFARHLDAVLSLLLAEPDLRVGEVRSRLAAASEPAHRQIGDMQRRVADLWGGVLGVEGDALRETSNYFEVGGTSLNAFKLVNRVRVEFQHDISIRDIIDYPTVAEFSRLLLAR